MARDVDERKKRKALRKLRKAAQLAEQGLGPPLSDWEREFLEEVEARVEKYGSAFADLEKGGPDEPLSALQSVKLREIDRKARGKPPTGFGRKKKLSGYTPRVKTLDDDLQSVPPAAEEAALPDKPPSRPKRSKGPPKLRVIRGGAVDE